jgi:hypothetical protein
MESADRLDRGPTSLQFPEPRPCQGLALTLPLPGRLRVAVTYGQDASRVTLFCGAPISTAAT